MIETLMSVLPIYVVLTVITVAAGITLYPFKKSVAQANAGAVLAGSLIALNLKTNLIYGQSPYVLLISLIAIIVALIIINIVISAKSKKNDNQAESLNA